MEIYKVISAYFSIYWRTIISIYYSCWTWIFIVTSHVIYLSSIPTIKFNSAKQMTICFSINSLYKYIPSIWLILRSTETNDCLFVVPFDIHITINKPPFVLGFYQNHKYIDGCFTSSGDKKKNMIVRFEKNWSPDN